MPKNLKLGIVAAVVLCFLASGAWLYASYQVSRSLAQGDCRSVLDWDVLGTGQLLAQAESGPRLNVVVPEASISPLGIAFRICKTLEHVRIAEQVTPIANGQQLRTVRFLEMVRRAAKYTPSPDGLPEMRDGKLVWTSPVHTDWPWNAVFPFMLIARPGPELLASRARKQFIAVQMASAGPDWVLEVLLTNANSGENEVFRSELQSAALDIELSETRIDRILCGDAGRRDWRKTGLFKAPMAARILVDGNQDVSAEFAFGADNLAAFVGQIRYVVCVDRHYEPTGQVCKYYGGQIGTHVENVIGVHAEVAVLDLLENRVLGHRKFMPANDDARCPSSISFEQTVHNHGKPDPDGWRKVDGGIYNEFSYGLFANFVKDLLPLQFPP